MQEKGPSWRKSLADPLATKTNTSYSVVDVVVQAIP